MIEYILIGIGLVVGLKVYYMHLKFLWKTIEMMKKGPQSDMPKLFESPEEAQAFMDSVRETFEKKLDKKKKDDKFNSKYKDMYR